MTGPSRWQLVHEYDGGAYLYRTHPDGREEVFGLWQGVRWVFFPEFVPWICVPNPN